MAKKYENNLDEMFFEQYEALTDEELSECTGGVLVNKLPDWFVEGLNTAAILAEAATSWFED